MPRCQFSLLQRLDKPLRQASRPGKSRFRAFIITVREIYFLEKKKIFTCKEIFSFMKKNIFLREKNSGKTVYEVGKDLRLPVG